MDKELYEKLAEKARIVSARAYAPYSHFQVGAAVLTEEGDIFAGCNVENASYGLTVCAERSAVFQAVAAAGKGTRISTVLVYTPTAEPTPPCGACRQVIAEFGPNAEVISICDGPDVLRHRIADLLPDSFVLNRA